MDRNMKKRKILIFAIASIFMGCNSKPSKKSNPIDLNIKPDTLVVYQPIDLDTISNTKDSFIGNNSSSIEIKTYALNDSSIVFTDGLKKEVFHDYATKITIRESGEIIQTSTFNRTSFKDSLQEPFKSKSILKSVKFDFIRSNCHYFDFVLETPNDSSKLKGEFMLFYRTKKKGIFYYGINKTDALNFD